MKFSGFVLLTLLVTLSDAPCEAQTITTLTGGLSFPNAVAVDANGNVFVADTNNSAVKEIVTAGGQVSVKTIGTGVGPLGSVALDAAGNIFASDSLGNRVIELTAASGYATANTLGSGFNDPVGLAVDSAGNVFVADLGNKAVKEILASGGYTLVNTLGSGFDGPVAVALDGHDNVFVADGSGGVKEILAAGDYVTVNSLGNGVSEANGIAVDASGNVFVADTRATAALEILADGGYATTRSLAGGFLDPIHLALDGAGNLFLLDAYSAWKLPAATTYGTAEKLGSIDGGDSNAIATDAAGDIFIVFQEQGGLQKYSPTDNYVVPTAIATPGFSMPMGLAVDPSGNLFVADTGNNGIKELTAASGFATVRSIGSGLLAPQAVAVDTQGNVFVGDTGHNKVEEILAAGGYTSQKPLAISALQPAALAVDRNGDLFIADLKGLTELTASGTVLSLVTQSEFFSGIAVDRGGNLFLSNDVQTSTTGFEVRERLASNGFATATAIANEFNAPAGLAVDGAGNIFVADSGNGAVREILAGPPPLVASVLPGARAIEFGTPATIFATMINTTAAPFDNCQISLSPPALFLWRPISLTYQTTDSATNQPTGQPNTPVTIAGGNGLQSFVLSFDSGADDTPFDATDLPLEFTCGSDTVLQTAPIVPGVDTVSLSGSDTPVADIIALAATPTRNGIITLPQGGVGAFAVASINVGAEAAITVSVDTGNAGLPVTATLCQTDPASGQCLSSPAAKQSLTYAAGAAPTFSIFLQSTGAIALNPATARVSVLFEDSSGALHGLTSVAVDTH